MRGDQGAQGAEIGAVAGGEYDGGGGILPASDGLAQFSVFQAGADDERAGGCSMGRRLFSSLQVGSGGGLPCEGEVVIGGEV